MSVLFQAKRRCVLRLVKPNLTSTGKLDLCRKAPPGFLHFRALHPSLRQGHHFHFQIVAQEVHLVPATRIRGVKGSFGLRQSKDQPATPGIHIFKPQNIAEKCPVRLGILAIENVRALSTGSPPGRHPLLEKFDTSRIINDCFAT